MNNMLKYLIHIEGNHDLGLTLHHGCTLNPNTTAMQSQTRMRPTCRAEVLEFILACGTRLEDPCIHILGVSTHGEDEVTDFDIRYSCSNQMKREHTYISYANNEFTDGTLDVPSLERYVQTGFKEPRLPDHLSFLQYWAKARVGEGPGSQAG